MRDINIKIKNGYGIRSFNETLTFERSPGHPHSSTVAIYAQNGTMKSSFSKTIHDHIRGSDIKDHIFGDPGECLVQDTNTGDIPKENILAITSFDTSPFEASNVSPLVASAGIKAKYDILMQKYDAAWYPLIAKIRKVARPKSTWKDQDILQEIISQYGNDIPIEPRSLMNLFMNSGERKEIDEAPEYIQEISYTKLDTTQVANFMKDNAGTIGKLVGIYNELRQSPTFYRNGFDASGARKFAESAKSSKYFDADHSLSLTNAQTGKPVPISSQDELERVLETDVDRVLSKHPSLQKPFKKLIEKFGAGNHGDLKGILENNTTKDIVLIMDNARAFKRRIWQGYLRACQAEADELIRVYQEIKPGLEKVLKEAKNEKTKWDEIAKQFNERFRNLPYTVHIDNKDSVILDNTKIPEIVLRYEHPTKSSLYKDLKKDEYGKYQDIIHLSTGERKAFYLLNILFELEVKQASGKPHLVILDDVIDSFDYKNKYAFLEYVNDISREYTNIDLILLTHNFDFFRLLESRLKPINAGHFFIASKRAGKISLVEADCFNLFIHMRKKAKSDKKVWLATLPLVRNLVEIKTVDISDPSTPFMAFTKCLHSLDDEQVVLDIQRLMQAELATITSHPFNDSDKIIDILLQVARSIADDNIFNIYDNIVLAMACRRMAEEYMKYKINNPDRIKSAKDFNKKGPFTQALFRIYKSDATLDIQDNVQKISEVNLITPEHIHLNAFAYEPLVDIDKSKLVSLRNEIDVLYQTIPGIAK